MPPVQARDASGPGPGAGGASGPSDRAGEGRAGYGSPIPPVAELRAGLRDTESGDVHAAAEHGVSGGAGPLPHLDQIQRSFGSHDVRQVKAHADASAAAGAEAMGADAFAMGEDVAFKGQPDLHTAAHEAAHVVQQRGGVELEGGVGEVGDAHERHADAVADLVVQGKSSQALLDGYAAPAAKAGGGGAVQRHVFVGGAQVRKSDPEAAGAAAWVADDVVRSYTSVEEMKQHAAGATDHLGNLADGTWLRFSPTGLNVLGENHMLVRLDMVALAVGSKNLIYEPFSDDDLEEGSALKAAYEANAAKRFQDLGVTGDKEKKQVGAESLFPKMGFALNLALPYFQGTKPIDELKQYVGKPIQSFLKMAWAHARDRRAWAATLMGPVPPKVADLITVFSALEGALDPFISGLSFDGVIGEPLGKPRNAPLLPLLAQFAVAFTDAMVELAVSDPTSRLDDTEKHRYATEKTSAKEKGDLFARWRNHRFEDSVRRAAASGVRYAGMGWAHFDYLRKAGLPANAHPYDMDGNDRLAFKAETARLAKMAIKQ